MAVTTYYVAEDGSIAGDGSLGNPMILGGASFTAMLAAETFAANAVRLAFLPGTHTLAAAITPTGTPTLDHVFEMLASDAAGALMSDPLRKYGPVSDWTAAELAARPVINVSSAVMASKVNVRMSGLAFNLSNATGTDSFTLGANSLVTNCRFMVNTIGAARLVLNAGADTSVHGNVFVFATSATTFSTAVYCNGGGVDIDSNLIIGPAISGGAGVRTGINNPGAGQRCTASGNVIARFPGHGITISGANTTMGVSRNVIANCGGAGIDIATIPTVPMAFGDMHITGCGGWGVGVVGSGTGVDTFGVFRMRTNTSGNIQTANMGDRESLATLITTAGSDVTDFADAANFDFRLSRGNPAYGLGVGIGDVGGSAGSSRFPRF